MVNKTFLASLTSQQQALSFHLAPSGKQKLYSAPFSCLGFLSGHFCTMTSQGCCVLPHLFDGLEAEATHVQQCWSCFRKWMQPLDYSYYTLEQGSECIPSLFLLKVTCGFSNWKDGPMGFRSQGNGATHNKAVEVMVTFPATTRDIGEQLSSQHAPQKVKNTEALLQIMSCIPFLSRQGLAMRGRGRWRIRCQSPATTLHESCW